MIAKEPKNRLPIGEILKDLWFGEIRFMNPDQLRQYEEKIKLKDFFESKFQEIKLNKQKKREVKKEKVEKKHKTKAEDEENQILHVNYSIFSIFCPFSISTFVIFFSLLFCSL